MSHNLWYNYRGQVSPVQHKGVGVETLEIRQHVPSASVGESQDGLGQFYAGMPINVDCDVPASDGVLVALVVEVDCYCGPRGGARIWRLEGLKVPAKQPKSGTALVSNSNTSSSWCASGHNDRDVHVWAYDFVALRYPAMAEAVRSPHGGG